MEPLIALKNVSVAYNLGKGNQVQALRNITCEIYPEEYIVFFGPSGCGKSTLLYTIAGLEAPTEGSVTVSGRDLRVFSERELIEYHQKEVGMVFQAFYLIPGLTVEGNIMLPRMFMEASYTQRIEEARLLMRRFGIAPLAKKYPSSLSGGQQQRVAIARALVNRPQVVLADEPVGNLDTTNAGIVLDLMSELHERDKKVIIHVTHNPQHLYHANRVFYMEDGKIIRITANPKKPSPLGVPAAPLSPLDQLAQLYPHLPESRLKAKLVLNHVLLSYTIEEQEKIEALIEAYLKGDISELDLFNTLNLAPEAGGVNLYEQTARSLTKSVASIAREMRLVGAGPYLAAPAEERATELRGYLLDSYEGKLSLEQIRRLEEFLAERVLGKLDTDDFAEALDRPFEQGGAGFNRRTARRFAQQVRTILASKQAL